MTALADQIDALDEQLFSPILSGTSSWDRRALLALHSAVASAHGSFDYLEIGSYLGGSLQALMRDPRCRSIASIDLRPPVSLDKRGGSWQYEDNSTEHMRELLGQLHDADLGKLTTFEVDCTALSVAALPAKPQLCFVDGEHTDAAVLRDARFCARAIDGEGVIAFHDYRLLRPAIETFLREVWSDVVMAIAFAGDVFAVELGGGAVLRSPVVDRAIASRWHSVAWRCASRSPRARPFLAVWSVMPTIDEAALRCRSASRHLLDEVRRRT